MVWIVGQTVGAITSGGGEKLSYHKALSLNHCRWRHYGHIIEEVCAFSAQVMCFPSI